MNIVLGIYQVGAIMADQAPSVARDAVLKESIALPEDMPQIKGYDFNQGVDHKALLQSFLTTGFQASSFGLAVQEINKMIEKRLEPMQEEHEGCDSDTSASGCTIFLGYTSNLISSVGAIMADQAPSVARDAVLKESIALPEDMPQIKGYDFNQGVDHKALLQSFLTTGFQASSFGLAVQEINKMGTQWTPSKMIHRLGKEINNPDSVYYWAYKNDIPVFSPALTDGSLGDMIYFHSYKNPGLVLDIVEDIRRLNSKAVFAKSTGMIILGGGLVKHHIANANLMRNGADFAVFVNTGQEFDGSDSGARPDEAVSWGKIRMDASPVKVYADASIVFPLLVAETFAHNANKLIKEKKSD
ncbi:deoxyhypusine synthase [Labeo rohita]|uniref:Deoxyhypusine synthase n=1 Tax=Labeo rohita TaxID=84645 RepID=A0A498NYQ4_LABRO|nr:deoxyhypusine synthase [Labeo rohita]